MTSFESKVERQKQGRIECTVTFAADTAKNAEQKVLERAGQSMNIKGFRPGKAPVEHVRERLNRDELLEEIIRELLPKTVTELVTEHKLNPVVPPRIEALSASPLSLKIIFVERPEVTLKGINKIKIAKREIKIDAKDIDRVVTSMQQRMRETKEAARASKTGDQVTVDFWAEDEEKKALPGFSANEYQVILGSETMLPGFEQALTGVTTGQQKSFAITIPEKHQATELRGKKVTFHVTVKKVEDVILPPMDDAFAKKFGAESLEKLRADVEQSMRMQEEDAEKAKRESDLLDEIRKSVQTEIAPELVEAEERILANELQEQVTRQGMSIQEWLKATNKSVEQLQKELAQRADERIKLRFGLEELIKEKQVTVSEDEINEEIARVLASVPPAQRDEVAKQYAKGEEGYLNIEWQKKVNKVLEPFLA